MADTSRDRLVRLLGMIAYLEAHGSTGFPVLAEHFGVSVERIERDLWALTTSGIPPYLPDECIEFDFDDLDEGVATLVASQGVSQVKLSGREAVALIGALATLVAAGTAPAGADDVLARLREAYGGGEPVRVLDGAPEADAGVTAILERGISEGRAVSLDYIDAQDRRSVRVIEPHRLVAIDGVGYVECFCLKADDHRTLRLGRVASVSLTDVMVTHPPSEERGFALAPQFDASVVLRRGARWAFEDLAGVEIEDDGDTATARFGVADVDWAAGRLLSVAPDLVSVEPAALREAVAAHAHAVAAAHSV
ncbi:helix-turn-helix transcriptional regulator [Demequina sp. SO4-18]|uniref:helix-turn-helix transcriptional regulator n=1 Tax=Demequina sp. SO4-18 TaxID=3401026 RepID=UPI003B5BA2B0